MSTGKLIHEKFMRIFGHKMSATKTRLNPECAEHFQPREPNKQSNNPIGYLANGLTKLNFETSPEIWVPTSQLT